MKHYFIGILFVLETILLILFIVLYATNTINHVEPQIYSNSLSFPYLQPVRNGIGFGMFDHVLYINLDKRIDRKIQVETELKKLGVPSDKITRVSAVLENPGAFGCSKSHLKALQIFEENQQWSNVLILEDDALLCQSREYIDYVLNQFSSLNIKWDVLQLLANVQKFEETDFQFLVRLTESQTTAGYAVNRHYLPVFKENVAQGVENLSKNLDQTYHYCIDIWWKTLQPESNWFTFHPVLGHQRDGFSDIENALTSYPDKRPLPLHYVPIKYVIAIKSQEKSKDFSKLRRLGVDVIYYHGNYNLSKEYEFDPVNHILVVKSENDDLNESDKFGKLLRFLRNYIEVQTSMFGVYFVDDDVNKDIFEKLEFIKSMPYWGKKSKDREISLNLPSNLEYCESNGFYLNADCIRKLIFRQDLFIGFNENDQSEKGYPLINVNVALGLQSFRIFPVFEKI